MGKNTSKKVKMNIFNEEIAGFSPYTRGYHTMGHILDVPKPQPIFFIENKNTENLINIEKTMFIFKKSVDLISSNYQNKSIFIDNFSLEMELNSEEIQQIYISSELFLQDNFCEYFKEKSLYKENIFPKIRVFFRFNEFIFEGIDQIRAVRNKVASWLNLQIIPSVIPIACHVANVLEQLYALSAQVDFILYGADNQCIIDFITDFIIENTNITKTIDPFFGGEK